MTSGWYLTNDKAVIMIAHRLKTVQKAERIFALENGKPYSREYMKTCETGWDLSSFYC